MFVFEFFWNKIKNFESLYDFPLQNADKYTVTASKILVKEGKGFNPN